MQSMSARTLMRMGLALGSRTVPRLSVAAPLAACCLAVVCYLVLRRR